MVKHPIIRDLIQAAGVSISTANRVINNSESVRQPTRELTMSVAQEIGFFGLSAIRHVIHARSESFRFGILLLQKHRRFYASLALTLTQAAITKALER